jgi:hypothetical protein
MSHFVYCYAECRYAECRYAEYRYAEYLKDLEQLACQGFFKNGIDSAENKVYNDRKWHRLCPSQHNMQN